MKIELTNEEALVLIEWLFHNSSHDELFQDKAAQYVLWSIECQLEKELSEPHSDHYLTSLTEARNAVRMKYGGE